MRTLIIVVLMTLWGCGDDGRTRGTPDGGGTDAGPLPGIPDPDHGPSVDGDIDGDGVPDASDNCPSIANADQRAVCTYPPRPQLTGDIVQDGVARVNWYRFLLGLRPVIANATQSRGCDLHLDYLVQLAAETGSPGLSHSEDLSKPYASEEGNQAGLDSVLSLGRGDIAQAVDGWMNTLYHRLPLIHPGLTEIGVGYAVSEALGFACIQYRPGTNGGATAPHAILWPPADIVGTDRQFGGNESPCPTVEDPLAGGPCPPSAAIPSIGLHGLGAQVDMSGTLINLDTGETVPLFATYFEGGPSPHEQGGYLEQHTALVPAPGSSLERALYEVTVQGTVAGDVFLQRWRFRTGRSFGDVGCDDMGEHRTLDTAFEVESGSVLGRVCDFADMYKITGSGQRTIRLELDHAEGDLDLVALDPDGEPLGRSDGANDIETLTVDAGNFVQVYGFNGGMGVYEFTVE